MRELLASPAVSFVGRHNSGKTTLVCAVIAELTARGLDVGSVKHHGHAGFSIDVPGKDSYRHREAGATETVIASPDALARIKTLPHEMECDRILATMPGHDIVIVEGYRASGVPRIEVMRQGNHRDIEAASDLLEFGFDSPEFRATGNGRQAGADSQTVAVVTDIPAVAKYAERNQVPVFDLPAAGTGAFDGLVGRLCDFLQQHFVRARVTVAIQAGGESRRMGASKALVDFRGEPLVSRMVRRMAPAADQVLVTTNGQDDLGFLARRYPDIDLAVMRDVCPQRGALPGLLTALEGARCPVVAVVAVDMAFASPELAAAEARLLHDSGADAVVPRNAHGFEPMHAAYRRDTCLPVVRTLVAQGSFRARDLLDSVTVRTLSSAEVHAIVPAGGCFANANTPEELERLQSYDLEDRR
ncbi:MAG: molybdopterin-guanine dinucleotide biosynthesis protein B [Eggerthellaceae bacterium]|jgi:molybdopterin-guanine dinucleotide biosynthesis protein